MSLAVPSNLSLPTAFWGQLDAPRRCNDDDEFAFAAALVLGAAEWGMNEHAHCSVDYVPWGISESGAAVQVDCTHHSGTMCPDPRRSQCRHRTAGSQSQGRL
ncbi:hypothetical protein CCHR01_13719 [Colletotrichum chrysophilum]|uniref:Uncharacterized protein n=1 Tax=Colletotrichum chrysophilum TaxID=1836956 RepID=A0AAD9ABN7_9PEZI|nr:hypothetical protein CCHR01_13719 [Colletotrichum chrysophilum]